MVHIMQHAITHGAILPTIFHCGATAPAMIGNPIRDAMVGTKLSNEKRLRSSAHGR